MEPHILDCIPDLSECKSFTERYFTKRYLLNANGIENNDIMVMFHSNRIALLCLAPSHFFFKNKEDYKINFTVGNVDRLNNSVKGKGKKGGQLLFPTSVICTVEQEDRTIFSVPSCMKATLVEVNEQLVKQPQLLRQAPESNGFIAILLASIVISETTKKELLSHEDYATFMKNKHCSFVK